MNVDCILIDLDGTIFDFKKSERNVLEKCFNEFNYQFTTKIYEQYTLVNHDLWQKFEKNEIEGSKILIQRFEILFQLLKIPVNAKDFNDQYQLYLSKSCELVDHAITVLDYLFKKYNLYVVTNGSQKTQMERLKNANLLSYFSDFFISETIGTQKPSKDFFDYCFDKIKTKRETSMIIGDSLTSDMLGGDVAGIITCWFNPQKLVNKTQIYLNYEINSLIELIDFL